MRLLARHKVEKKGGRRCRPCNSLRQSLSRIPGLAGMLGPSSWGKRSKSEFYKLHSGLEISESDLLAAACQSVERSSVECSARALNQLAAGICAQAFSGLPRPSARVGSTVEP